MTKLPRDLHAPVGLQAPIKDLIDDTLPEADVQRMWRDLQNQNTDDARNPRLPALRVLRARPLAIGAGFAIALCSALLLLRAPTDSGTAPALRGGPLAIVGTNATTSGLGPAQAFGGAQPARLSLDDGSRIDLGPAARLEVLENSNHSFATHLRQGRGEFEVKPGGPRRWSIECGVVTVEVVGTHFAIDRSERGVRVDVARGVVLVRGERVADRVRKLTAGQSLFVSSASDDSAPGSALPAHAPAAATEPAPAGLAPTAEAPTANAEQPRSLADVPSAATVDQWLRRADAARRDDQPARAEALLERVVQRAQGSPHAAVAALTLARLLMQSDPARAAAALASVHASGAPNGLREDIMARLVEALARAGRHDLAREAASDYSRAFPHGRLADEVRQWTHTP